MTAISPAVHPADSLRDRASKLGLNGLLTRWDEFRDAPWLKALLDLEAEDRQQRSLLRRIHAARLGIFKSINDFDWTWPTKIDRDGIEDLLRLGFVEEAANIVLIGGNGLGKTTIATNILYRALLAGHTALRVTASEMLNDLASRDTARELGQRLRHYCRPTVLMLDEVGYLAFGNRHGDLLYEVVSRRHHKKPIVLTTNRVFKEWGDVFPNSSCVAGLVDRLTNRAEIIKIEGDSYREKEAKERAARKAQERKARQRGKS
ncbi:MAG: ATP-binding protein [Planctomycetes bacterium]|nr:ATP-binding protein [Planctomycetota bacterium]